MDAPEMAGCRRLRRAVPALGPGALLCALLVASGGAVLCALWCGAAGPLPAVVLTDEERVAVTEEAQGLSLGTGARCPTFSLPSCSGDTVALADLLGQRVAVVFVQPGCPSCDRLGQLLASRTSLRNHHLLLISSGDRARAEAFRREQHLVAPLLLDKGGTIARLYGAASVPTAYLIDEAGMLAGAARGARCWALVEDGAP